MCVGRLGEGSAVLCEKRIPPQVNSVQNFTERCREDRMGWFGHVKIQIQNCLFDIICQVIEQHTLCIINVRRLPLRQLVVADMGAT